MRLFLMGFLLAFGFSTQLVHASDDMDKIKQRVEKEIGAKADSISATPIAGLYEVVISPRIFYMSADGRYVMSGELIDLEEKRNVTKDKLPSLRKTALENIGEEAMVVFAPEKEVKHTISVFTDIDCGYCRKLHQEMAEYNKHGIKVRYLAYPRAGVGSEAYEKAVSVWCADDRQKAMTAAKTGGELKQKTCDNPVEAQFMLGQQLGISGTPALMLEDGQIFPGYVPADRLITMLDKAKQQAAAAK